MKEWLSIKEASSAFKKHPDTIRNFIKRNPEAMTRDEHGKLFVKTELLEKAFPTAENENEARAKQGEIMLETLMLELKTKNEEISRLHKIVEEMSQQQARLIDQQQSLSAFLLKADNSAEDGKKKHWWNKK